MLRYVALGLLLALVLYWLGRRLVAADPARLARALRWTTLGGGGLVLLYLAVSGRLAAVAAFFALLLPLILRARAAWRRVKPAGGATEGRHSEIRTRYLRMSLDHDTGVMSGTVLEGRFRGRELRALAMEDLIALWDECRAADEQSALVLETYLDRTEGEAWRTRHDAGGAAREQARGGGPMTREEACQILGVAPDASPAEIKAAHRRLMQKLHPDQGGSTYLAAKINEARDLLLGR